MVYFRGFNCFSFKGLLGLLGGRGNRGEVFNQLEKGVFRQLMKGLGVFRANCKGFIIWFISFTIVSMC